MEITDLPRDVFLLIVAHLSARTAALCRHVSKRWQAAFTDQDLSLQLLKWHFPRCREMRMAYAAGGGDISRLGMSGSSAAHEAGCLPGHARRPIEMLGGADDGQAPNWTAIFTTVARRHHHLRTATPRSIEKVRLGTTGRHQDRFCGVATWDRYLRLDDKTAPFHHPDPSWCYGGQDDGDGLLVYHAHPGDAAKDAGAARAHVYPWRLLDLESREEQEVPFPHDDDRIVRRVRLADGVLAFEWCERTAYHQLNDREECHRHYVSVLDVVRTSATSLSPTANTTLTTPSTAAAAATSAAWRITPRAEFKFHFLGLPLNAHDRFLSAHTRTHYAVYVWQPNRSPWGEDGPIESAIVWDTTCSPPRIVRRMAWATLAFYGVRQRSTPRLRCLGLDDRNLYLVEEEHRWARGSHSSLRPPRVHLVRSTGIPVVPALTEGGNLSLARTAASVAEGEGETIVQGPRWLDECGASGDVNLSFCSRAAGAAPPQHLVRYQHHPAAAPAPTAPIGPGIWNASLPPPVPGAYPAPTIARELGAAARAPAGRWPGWAPCWRHEEFPYLTVGEAVDFRAGLRVAARHCFMLETLSVHVRPSLSVRGILGGARVGGGDTSSSSSSASSSLLPPPRSSPASLDGGGGRGGEARSVDGRVSGKLKVMGKSNGAGRGGRKVGRKGEEDGASGSEEVQFPDEMWDELLGRGCIYGDERWLVGEDREGRVTIVRF